jgi:hypothetical protein
MIKQGVVIKNKTLCPITGKPCDCKNPNVECERDNYKKASLQQLSSKLDEKEDFIKF